jgi:hypothetical protein
VLTIEQYEGSETPYVDMEPVDIEKLVQIFEWSKLHAKIEIYISLLEDTEPNIGLVFDRGVYACHGLGDDGSQTDYFAMSVESQFNQVRNRVLSVRDFRTMVQEVAKTEEMYRNMAERAAKRRAE